MTTAELVQDLYPSRCGSRPEMHPRIDPVVYRDWYPDAPISEEQFAGFARDGFLVLHDVLDEDEVALIWRMLGLHDAIYEGFPGMVAGLAIGLVPGASRKSVTIG